MSNIAIIPARGGSKRIPLKNIKEFIGKPIIAYSIENAIKCGLFEEVMVSTDDDKIADIAVKFGANVPFRRSQKASDDFATTADVINEVLSDYKTKLNKSYTNICCIYPTAPLIQIKHLQAGFSKMIDGNLSSVYPIVKFSYPIRRGVTIDEHEKIRMIWPKYTHSRSQDITPVYHDAGQWYWFKVSDVADSLLTGNTEAIILEETEVQDIDNLTDWRIAELKYKLCYQLY